MTRWEEVAVVPVAPFVPRFAQMFEYRATGPWPFSGGERAVAEGWVRLRKPVAMGAPEVIAAADAYWPASLACAPGPRPMATVTFTLQLLADPAALDPAEPLYYRAVAAAGNKGFVAEFRELWTAKGALVALNQQTFVVIEVTAHSARRPALGVAFTPASRSAA